MIKGAIHSTKIPTSPTGKSGPPQKVDQFFQNFSGWTEPIHGVLDRNFRKFWLNGSRAKALSSFQFGPGASPGVVVILYLVTPPVGNWSMFAVTNTQ